MKQVVIENPVVNSPFREPERHFRFADEGMTNEIVESRRISSYLVPIAQPRKEEGQKRLVFDSEWTQDRIEENKLVNQIRARVPLWREGGYNNHGSFGRWAFIEIADPWDAMTAIRNCLEGKP